jgi:hypothetical protein
MWKLDGTRGQLNTPELSASLDLTQPHRGLHVATIFRDGHSSAIGDNHVLQVHFPEEPRAEDVQDSWIRGTDLVVTYAQRKNRQVTAEIYWRLVGGANSVGTELILSVQTDLLDATPTTSAASEIITDEVLWLGDPTAPHTAESLKMAISAAAFDRTRGQGIFIFRLAGSRLSYVDMVHPTDFSSASLRQRDGSAVLDWQLFPDSLEKGVIRRARLRGLFVNRQDDLALAARCFQEFTTSPLPLTT